MLPIYQEETIKSCKNLLVKDLKDQFIRMNIKQKVRIKIKMNIGIFRNQSLLESIDYMFQFIQTKMIILKGLKLEDIIYQKA